MPDLGSVGSQIRPCSVCEDQNHLTPVIGLWFRNKPSCFDQPFDDSPDRGMTQSESVRHRFLSYFQAIMLIQVIDNHELRAGQFGEDAPHRFIHLLFQQGIGYLDQPFWPMLRQFRLHLPALQKYSLLHYWRNRSRCQGKGLRQDKHSQAPAYAANRSEPFRKETAPMPSKQRRFTNTQDMREGLGRNHASGKRVYLTEETARRHREDR